MSARLTAAEKQQTERLWYAINGYLLHRGQPRLASHAVAEAVLSEMAHEQRPPVVAWFAIDDAKRGAAWRYLKRFITSQNRDR